MGLDIKHILTEEELDEKATTELFSVVQQEGKRSIKRNLKFYNLDMILSVWISCKLQKRHSIPHLAQLDSKRPFS